VSNVSTTLASVPDAETFVTPIEVPFTVTEKLLGMAVVAVKVSLYVSVRIVPVAPRTAVLITGGIAYGVTAFDATEADEGMSPFTAVDVKEYAVPLVRPVITHDPDAPVTVHVLLESPTMVTM
jgi:hypothetical protein